MSDKHHRYYKHTKFHQNPRSDPKFLVDLTWNDPYTNSTNITFNGMSQVYNGTNATDIPLNISRNAENVNVTVCDQNNVSFCQVVTPGEYLLVH